MITEDKIAKFIKRFEEQRSLYRILPDTEDNRRQVEKDIASIGIGVFGSDWPEFSDKWLNIRHNNSEEASAAR